MLFLGTMSTECIGRLILRWLTKYGRYITASNNCQHFVRDIVSVMNIDIARKLPAFFDNKIITAIIPAAATANIINEEARMLEVADMLSVEIENYQNIVDERLQEERNQIISSHHMDSDSDTDSDHNDHDNDFDTDRNRKNIIDSVKWDICAQFIGLQSDGDDIPHCIQWRI